MKTKNYINFINLSSSYNQPNKSVESPKPYLRERLPSFQNIQFQEKDVEKLIAHLILKGNRFSHLKKTIPEYTMTKLQCKLLKNGYMKIMLHKIMGSMGDCGRLGASLRGLNRMLLQQIEESCWGLIKLQLQLLGRQEQERRQLQLINNRLESYSSQNNKSFITAQE